jgi:hypothetical protein
VAIPYQIRRVVGSWARSWLNLGNLVAISYGYNSPVKVENELNTTTYLLLISGF